MIAAWPAHIRARWEAARCHCDYGVPLDALVERVAAGLAQRGLTGADADAAAEGLAIEDLILALPRLRGSQAAMRRLMQLGEAVVRSVAGPIVPGRVDDFCADLWAEILVARRAVAGQPPRLAAYLGIGTLRSWLKVIARRAAIDRRRQVMACRECALPETVAAEAAPAVDLQTHDAAG